MAKAIALIASAICFLAITSHAYIESRYTAKDDQPRFEVQGEVFCDRCQVLFSTPGAGLVGNAELEMQCRNPVNGSVTIVVKGRSDDGGFYSLYVDNDHENEICEVKLLKSIRPDCNIIAPKIRTARVTLINKGVGSGMIHMANPIGFQTQKADASCRKTLDDMGYVAPPVNKNKNKKNKRVSIRRGF